MHRRSAIASFLEDASTQRLFITSDGKDLAAVSLTNVSMSACYLLIYKC